MLHGLQSTSEVFVKITATERIKLLGT
jgi:hypothetical protein